MIAFNATWAQGNSLREQRAVTPRWISCGSAVSSTLLGSNAMAQAASAPAPAASKAAALTAAHPSPAFGSKVKITNTKNKRSVVVVINGRGPSAPGRIIDVTQAAATRLGFVRAGAAEATLEVVGKLKMGRGKK